MEAKREPFQICSNCNVRSIRQTRERLFNRYCGGGYKVDNASEDEGDARARRYRRAMGEWS